MSTIANGGPTRMLVSRSTQEGVIVAPAFKLLLMQRVRLMEILTEVRNSQARRAAQARSRHRSGVFRLRQ